MAKTGKRSFATIRRLPSGRYQVRYTAPDGLCHTAPRTFSARIDAEEYAAARRREIDAQTWTPTSAVQMPLFGVYAQNWLNDRQVAGRPIKDRTRALYASILERHLIPVFGTVPLNAIRSNRRPRLVCTNPGRLPDRPRAQLRVAAQHPGHRGR